MFLFQYLKLGGPECSQVLVVLHVFALLFGPFQHVHGVADLLVGHNVAGTVAGLGQAANGVIAAIAAVAAAAANAPPHRRRLGHHAVFFGHDAAFAVGIQPVVGQHHKHGG